MGLVGKTYALEKQGERQKAFLISAKHSTQPLSVSPRLRVNLLLQIPGQIILPARTDMLEGI